MAGATITGADFSWAITSGFTRSQFESTASYASGDLAGILLVGNDLTGWNFAGKTLTDASFYSATLTNADLTGARIAGQTSRRPQTAVLPSHNSNQQPAMPPATWPNLPWMTTI